jgi:hypothetical protein
LEIELVSRLRSQTSPAALVVALIALFVAIGGVAGALPGKNSVDGGDIKRNSVASPDIRNDKVTGRDVNEKTLKVPIAALPPGSGATIGVSATDGGSLSKSTLPGVTLQKPAGDLFAYTFPRDVANCVPVVWGTSSGSAPFSLGPGAAPNQIVLDQGTGPGAHNMIVVCPD